MGFRPPLKARRRANKIQGTRVLEHLESRVLLSAAVAPADHKYRTDSFTGAAADNYGHTYVNPTLTDAQHFFDLYHTRFGPYTPPNPDPGPDPAPDPSPDPTPDPAPDPAPDPTPDPTPDPDPIPPPNPDPVPDPAPAPGDPVAITQNQLGNFTRLTITGTSGNDTITVAQSGDTLTITANGNTTSVTGTFTELAVYGADGNDTITVQSSVTLTSLLYGGAGNNTIAVQTSAKSFVVTLGAGVDHDSGNANTSFWADTTDTITGGTAAATHKIAGFYEPFSSTPGTPGYISTTLDGSNLPDPTDSGSTTRLTASLWGAGPTMPDMNQGQIGDCYFLASLQSLAQFQPGMLEQMAVDLGDGTYAVEFQRGGNATYIRVDGDLPTAPWGGLYYAHPTSGGAIWQAIIEKAYAFFRTGANTFASLNWGWTGSAFNDLGVPTSTFSPYSNAYSQITTALANNKAIAAVTNGTVTSADPIIGSHAYSIIATSISNGVQYITVRNPWGFDGAGSDSNTSDGLVTITWSQFCNDFSSGSIQV